MKEKRIVRFSLIVSLVAMGLVFSPWPCFGAEQEKEKEKPERLVEMAAEYPGVVVPVGDDVSMDVIVYNRGRSNEDVDVWIASKPKGWEARVKTYKFEVKGVNVPADDNKRLTFEAKPDKDVKPGTYTFRINAQTKDGQFKMAKTVQVIVEKKRKGVKEGKGIKLTTSYPVLRGPSDAKFEFSVEVESELDKEAVFDLVAKAPEDWIINFKPAYEDKYISSLRLKEKASKTVAMEVKPSPLAKAGEYPINMRVSSGDAKAEAKLTVAVTGTYKLEAGTPTGLLSLDAKQGKEANVSIYVKNTGTATNHGIKFMSFKPENWKVEFEPEKIAAIEPGDLKQIEVTITPYEEALVGDYSVAVDVQGEKVSKPIEFRVSVRASTAWGWIGIGIIVVVVLGLTGLFRWLGRR